MGKKVLIVILVVLLAAGGYGFYWMNGLKTVDNSYMTPKAATGDLEKTYKTVLADSVKGQASIPGADCEAVTQKLFSETSFFHLAQGSAAKIDSVILGVNGNNAEIRMVIDISGIASTPYQVTQMGYGSANTVAGILSAPNGLPFLKADKFGVKAQLELKEISGQIGVRPISITVGSSGIPVGLAMNAVRKYAPSANVTADNFILLQPMTVTDGASGKPLFTITNMEVKDGNLILHTK